MQSMLGYFCMLSQLLRIVTATITVGDKYYQSMPAVFGMAWHPMVQYKAHAQTVEDNPFLCHGLMNSRHLTNETVVAPTDGIPGTFIF
jgi:hypothetical protein